ncbi:spermidine/putrescine ABC transporter substrate-binding protein [Alphaproteobacteria bacterium KMM 3653]|uniref:Putrescine-binding periplasmic protein n=1 Tax=Harenicola maris TaxID=2841044 RepID=A0AAP2CR13_9RHOB|nr:spermidine/putrescine ABC transporter substrate-binding protein [Harenicola maris]
MTSRNFRPNRRSVLGGMGAVGLSFGLPGTGRAAEGTVNFYNWDTYIGETTLAQFTDATGVKVQYDLFADNEELFAKFRNGNPGYDLIVPTNDFVERFIVADLLEEIDHAKIPNLANIDPAFADPAHDPGRKYSVPYMWGTIGIGYRKSAVSTPPTSWADLYTSEEYAGRIALLGEPTTVFQMAFKLMGKSMNDWSDENLAAAEAMLIAQKKNITAFAPDNGQDLLLAGEVDLAMEWNGDVLQVMEEDDDIGYVVPKEGTMVWEDDLCIPKGAPNPDGAHALINHILDAEQGAEIADFIYYATPNAAARTLMDAEYTENPAIFPAGEAMEKSEVSIFSGQETLAKIDAAWTRVRAAG